MVQKIIPANPPKANLLVLGTNGSVTLTCLVSRHPFYISPADLGHQIKSID